MRRTSAALITMLAVWVASAAQVSRSEPKASEDHQAPAADPAPASPAPAVIVLSLDGVRHDYLDRAEFPAFDRIARDGLRASRLVPVYPSSTFPGHVSLATGATPAVHGIVDNRFWDRVRRERFDYANDASWIEAEPLWAAAERQGVPAATFFWVGSETDWRGVGARYRVAPFDAKVGEAVKVAQILAWLDLPARARPRLVMCWWHGADRAGHANGPDHADVVRELASQDRQLAALLAGLDARGAWSHTTLVVVSDHGMTRAGHSVPIARALRSAKVRAHLELGTAVAHVFLDDPAELARAERALAGLAGVRVDRREALPAALGLSHPSRTGDLVARAEPPHTFADAGPFARARELLASFAQRAQVSRSDPKASEDHQVGERRPSGKSRGVHGYAPEHPDMAGIFLAIGRGVPPGLRPTAVRMIDVAPTVARLLGIDPPRHAEGRAIEAFAP